ncbi:DCP2-domain-containing protein [Lactarius deliciosus]|nr:DCP2-domain-containing protein [Lactarius deliciosus]
MASSSSSSPELSPPSHTHPPNPYKYSTIDEVLDDLSSRFILNLPDGELASLERICFQVEQAHWYYEDFIREENSKFPSLPLKKFSEMFFQACPLLERWSGDHDGAFDHFMRYKTRVPVCGAIMLNDSWDKVVLVKGWKSSSGWGFPKGKINQNEPPHECAAREVAEETGYNLNGKIDPESVIEMEIKEQQISLFVVPGVSEDFPFETKTRKEISKIEWFRLADLPTWKRNKAVPGKFYLISPFIGPLKAFINEHKPRKPSRRTPRTKDPRPKHEFPDESDASVVEFHSRPTPHLDASAQESGSQTSSADNGDPQTPSPLYSEALPTHVDIAPVTESNGFGAKAVDPHFARLLSALTSSAKANGGNVGKIDNVPLASAVPLSPSVPLATGEVLTLHGNPQARTAPSSINVAGDSAAAALFRPKPSKQQANVAVPSDNSSRPDNSSPGAHMSSPSLASLSTAMSGLSTPQSPSAKSTHSRGTSMVTADLSPYLARPAGIPINGKRLKQLALLEAVADQSSRMTPAPAMRPMTHLQLSPGQVPPTPAHAPLPPNTAMPHNFTNLSSMYSNTHGPYLHHVPQTGHFNPPTPDNAFIVRPRTSNSFCPAPSHPPRPFNSRGSMNQAQLLGALSGSSHPSLSGFHRPPIPLAPNVPGPGTYPIPPIHSVMTGIPPRTGPYPPAVGRGPPLRGQPSRSTSGPVPVKSLPFTPAVPFSHSTVSPQNSQLLNILNRGSGQ